jgi:glycosyltransferase involved in cell wall biosynthesis
MNMKKTKRALWLMNHSTLRQFELPILQKMGYEIFLPKSFPYDEGNLSASLEYGFDKTLTLSASIIERLNEVDFYGKLDEDVIALINTHFDIAFIGFFPEQLFTLVAVFRGTIVFQPFGLSNGMSYTRVLCDYFGAWIISYIRETMGERFIFGQAYEGLSLLEGEYFQARSTYLPVGLYDTEIKSSWTGSLKKILFVCPRIKTSPYYHSVYENFKKHFGHIPHTISGAQPISVDFDKSITGFLDRRSYDEMYNSHAVMFYHSQEQNHLHYHPLEAIVKGLPLLFMAGGMLDQLGGSNLPGHCLDYDEARSKIKKILRGDKQLIREIKESQPILLERFKYDFCLERWQKNLGDRLRKTKSVKTTPTRRRRLAVILPAEYTGGVLDYTLRFVKSLAEVIKKKNDDTDIIFGYLEHDNYKGKDYFRSIIDLGVQMRTYTWEIADHVRIREILALSNLPLDQASGNYCLPNDGINYFDDCDYVIFTSDRAPEKPFLLKPYGVCVHDYIQHQLPGVFGQHYQELIFAIQRNAQHVFVYSEPTAIDCIQYAGLPKEKIIKTPLLFDQLKDQSRHLSTPNTKSYFLWSTNTSVHKNHKQALTSLSKYYALGGMLDCYITGANTEMFMEGATEEITDMETAQYIRDIQRIIKTDKLLGSHIKIQGNLPKDVYLEVLKSATFVFHPGLHDAGNMSIFDAAMLGVPALSADYPAMRYYETKMHLGITFFDASDIEAIANLLIDVERSINLIIRKVPSYEKLVEFTVEKTKDELYDVVMKAVTFSGNNL